MHQNNTHGYQNDYAYSNNSQTALYRIKHCHVLWLYIYIYVNFDHLKIALHVENTPCQIREHRIATRIPKMEKDKTIIT